MTPFVDDAGLTSLARFLKEAAGLELSKEKDYLIEFRLRPIAEGAGMGSLAQLCRQLEAPEGSRLRGKVIEAMTTHETLFFRDPKVFETLKRLLAARRSAGLPSPRIWSAACSTGQEPYSLAMLLLEQYPDAPAECVVATDIAEETLESAALGRYSVLQINRGLPITQLVKHFDRDGAGWKVKPALRRLVRFQRSNLLLETPREAPFELVLCRNVLIYFDRPTAGAIVDRLRRALRPGGHLLLGSSENLLGRERGFAVEADGAVNLYRAEGS